MDPNTTYIISVCRGSWWESMTLAAYLTKATLDAYETNLIADNGLTAESIVWAFVHESEGVQYFQGLTLNQPPLEDDYDY